MSTDSLLEGGKQHDEHCKDRERDIEQALYDIEQNGKFFLRTVVSAPRQAHLPLVSNWCDGCGGNF